MAEKDDYPGYSPYEAEAPFVRHIGRLYFKHVLPGQDGEEFWMGMPIEAYQTNIWGFAHATLIASLAEISAGAPAYRPNEDPFLIVQMNVTFIKPASQGEFVESCGILVERTKSLCFTRSYGTVGGRKIFAATAVHKRIKLAP